MCIAEAVKHLKFKYSSRLCVINLVVVEGLFRWELAAAVLWRHDAVSLSADTHESTHVTQQQGCVHRVWNRIEIMHALLKTRETLLPQLLVGHAHTPARWRRKSDTSQTTQVICQRSFDKPPQRLLWRSNRKPKKPSPPCFSTCMAAAWFI